MVLPVPGSSWKPGLGMAVGHLQGDQRRLGNTEHLEEHLSWVVYIYWVMICSEDLMKSKD